MVVSLEIIPNSDWESVILALCWVFVGKCSLKECFPDFFFCYFQNADVYFHNAVGYSENSLWELFKWSLEGGYRIISYLKTNCFRKEGPSIWHTWHSQEVCWILCICVREVYIPKNVAQPVTIFTERLCLWIESSDVACFCFLCLICQEFVCCLMEYGSSVEFCRGGEGAHVPLDWVLQDGKWDSACVRMLTLVC